MQKKYTFPIIIAILVLILGAGLFWLNKISTPTEIGTEITLFTSETCPHCKNVEDFIRENKINEKISFVIKESTTNPLNYKSFMQVGKKCKIPTEEMGFPLLWDGEKCLMGDKDIIDFFKQKAGIN